MTLNKIEIEGYLFDIKNISLGIEGVLQVGTLVYDRGKHHILVKALPDIKVALIAGHLFRIAGKLHGDHIDILEATCLN